MTARKRATSPATSRSPVRPAAGSAARAGTSATKPAAAPGPTHVALLRALNVGGTSVLPMADLKAVFEKAGAREVKTLQAAGNVWFAAADVPACIAKVRAALAKRMKREPAIMVESLDALRALVRAKPFGAAPRPEGTTWYVAFLDRAPAALPRLPHLLPTGDVTYRTLIGRALCISVVPLPGNLSVDNVNPEKFAGVSATVRNWNTVLRLVGEQP
ncbi:MAG: DUF1697 domain-containing protein [Gemmatimonadetes bacterium]|nr:DUF1697 domain-containing protein [Gemmatimonadota bacterium]